MALFIGQFVVSSENDLGTGKVFDVNDTKITIEYFDSPVDTERELRDVARTSVKQVRLGNSTRVYFFDQETGQFVPGRVTGLSHADQPPKYLVQLLTGEKVRLPETDLFARWRRPIKDPTDLLAGRIAGDPFAHECRSRFVESMIKQRASSAGMAGVLSSVIDLERHQVEVVRRVLRDPVQRYLLADEVGLGKTIEAGMIIRQYVLDHPDDHSVLIVVPPHLRVQWREELITRFLLEDYLGETIHLLPSCDIERISALRGRVEMLVIDEAHRLMPNRQGTERIFSTIKEIALSASRLLLLSATPVLRNEEGFLAMLHLLDPVNYKLKNINAFRQRVNNRQEIAEIFHSFTEDNQNFFLQQLALELQGYFPKDQQLAKLIEIALPLLDFDVPQDALKRLVAIRAIRAHISETYRLHRRLLRTRRSKETTSLLPGRAGAQLVRYTDLWEKRATELLDDWRITASGETNKTDSVVDQHELSKLLLLLLETTSSDLDLLTKVVRARLDGSDTGDVLMSLGMPEEEIRLVISTPYFLGEEEILNELITVLSGTAEKGKAKIESVRLTLDTLQQNNVKTLIFVNSQETAISIYELLEPEYGDRIALHSPEENSGHIHPAWHRFREDPYCTILVCSRESEEGLNLHGGNATIIHYDLPFSPNRIEQRIGRLDRYGDGEPVQSIVLVEDNAEIMECWYECLDGSFGVFERSVASLQYLVEEWQAKLLGVILPEGADAIREASQILGGNKGEIEEELRRIRAQDELDAIEVAATEEEDYFRLLSCMDTEFNSIQSATEGWVVDQMLFAPHQEGPPHSRMLRYGYQYDGVNPGTLIPPEIMAEHYAHAIDQEQPNYQIRPTSHLMSFNRATACRRGIHVARLGEPFIDAMLHYTQWDDCGMCFALWKRGPGSDPSSPVELAFRFDFIIEGNDVPALQTIARIKGATPEAVRRLLDEFFPPIYSTIWLDEELSHIQDTELLELLSRPYSPNVSAFEDREYPVQGARWRAIDAHIDPGSWASLCRSARTRAEDILASQVELEMLTKKRAEKADDQNRLHLAQLESRISQSGRKGGQRTRTRVEREKRLADALVEGILAPSIRLDAVGAVFISGEDLFREGSAS